MPRLSLRQLLIFAAIAETGSTTTAGVRLSLSQSATSAALNELEHLLGTRLFDRVGRRLLLNETGRALQPRARALLDNAMGVERDFAIHSHGSGAQRAIQLRVGASTTIGNYLLPSIVARFRDEWPTAHIDVQIGNTQDVSASVGRLDVDVGLIEGPCHERGIRAESWIEDELIIICAPTHPLVRAAKKHPVSVASLREEPWLLREPGSGTRESVEQALLPHLDQLREGMQFGSTEAIKQAAAEGLGLTCLSHYAVEDLITLGRVLPLRTTLPRLTRRFYLIHHPQKYFSSALNEFVTHCRKQREIRSAGGSRSR
jgi:DNA-binding transcriptional LysR family regulator